MSETPSKIVVDVRAVEKHFGEGNNRIHVLKKVNLQAYAGEIMMLVGPSGCGKTTLLSAIAGTLRVEAGEVNVFGKPLHSMPSGALTRFRASNIGFICQQFNLIPTRNIADLHQINQRSARLCSDIGLGIIKHHIAQLTAIILGAARSVE